MKDNFYLWEIELSEKEFSKIKKFIIKLKKEAKKKDGNNKSGKNR